MSSINIDFWRHISIIMNKTLQYILRLGAIIVCVLVLGEARAQTHDTNKAVNPVWRGISYAFTDKQSGKTSVKVPFKANLPDTADLLIEEARRHLGAPYHYGGKGPRSFDCAGFARYVYLKFGYKLPPSSPSQYLQGRRIKNTKHLQKGDLVFWQGRGHRGGVGHTGIVTEVDTNTGVFRFIHAATSSGVIQSYSTEEYYAKRYIGASRILGDRQKPEDPLPQPARRNHSRKGHRSH